jgi:CubicO group peptidase (beta-lactamase class C family)
MMKRWRGKLTTVALASIGFAGGAAAQVWPKAEPKSVGLDAAKLAALDADLAGGAYGLVDSMLVIRCGKQAYEHTYTHDYDKIYGDRAKIAGPLNHTPAGEYNYFSSEFHPYYEDRQVHTMQSVSKTVTSVTIGAAIEHKEFNADLDTPILKYFDGYKIANLDDRKRRITLRHLLTMTAGLEWHEDLPYDDPKNSADVMEAQHDWVQYVIDQPMVSEPGEEFVYSSGESQLLSHIFRQVTGQTVDNYANKYVFKPLGVDFYWKHSPTGLPDTEGGLYLAPRGLARIGAMYLNGGKWDGQQIVPAEWVKLSVTPHVQLAEEGWKYGFQWWLGPHGKPQELAWAARGFGGQELLVIPEYATIAVFTGWSILPTTEGKRYDTLERVLDAVDKKFRCEAGVK